MNTKAFTLIELIVVITILAILGTVAFISFKGFNVDARNAVRSTDLSNIKNAISLTYVKDGVYPHPTEAKSLTIGGEIVGQYGTAGDSVLAAIGVSGRGKDPLTEEEYYYGITGSRFSLLGFYEGDDIVYTNKTAYAVDKSNGNAKIVGTAPYFITKSDYSLLSVDIKDSPVEDILLVGNNNTEGFASGEDIGFRVKNSCLGIRDFGANSGSGIYSIKLEGIDTNVYCDMTTDGGGWTVVYSGNLETTASHYSHLPTYASPIVTNGEVPTSNPNDLLEARLGTWPKYKEYMGAVRYSQDFGDSSTVNNERKFATGNYGYVGCNILDFTISSMNGAIDYQGGKCSDTMSGNWEDIDTETYYQGIERFGINRVRYNHRGQTDYLGQILETKVYVTARQRWDLGRIQIGTCGKAWGSSDCRDKRYSITRADELNQKFVLMVR